MSVEPVVYNESNVIPVKPGDIIPAGSLVFYVDGTSRWASVRYKTDRDTDVRYYAPTPILELPEEPKEVPFKDAMERIVIGGERLGWRLGANIGQVVYMGYKSLMVSREGYGEAVIEDIRTLSQGTFYELPVGPEPQPKTGLKWWEAIEAVRDAGKWIRYVGLTGEPCDCWDKWNKSGVLMDGNGNEFVVAIDDLDAEWEIVE